jgi:hypothetical protein
MRSILLSTGLAVLLAAGADQAASARPKPVPSVDNVYWMVDCLVKLDNGKLEKVLATVPGAKGSDYPWFRAALYECLVEERPLPKGEFYNRGAIAEKFLYRDFSSIGSAARHRPAPVFAPVGADYLAEAERSTLVALTMLDAASCLVRSDRARAYSFFRTARGSAEERAKVTIMAPILASCLPKGQPLTITPAMFRAYFAEAAYRVAAGQPEVFEGQS